MCVYNIMSCSARVRMASVAFLNETMRKKLIVHLLTGRYADSGHVSCKPDQLTVIVNKVTTECMYTWCGSDMLANWLFSIFPNFIFMAQPVV